MVSRCEQNEDLAEQETQQGTKNILHDSSRAEHRF